MRIARTPQGKRICIGEGGNSVVYKAIMHNYDEVALKLVRMAQPTRAELELFEKEVRPALHPSIQIVSPGIPVWAFPNQPAVIPKAVRSSLPSTGDLMHQAVQ